MLMNNDSLLQNDGLITSSIKYCRKFSFALRIILLLSEAWYSSRCFPDCISKRRAEKKEENTFSAERFRLYGREELSEVTHQWHAGHEGNMSRNQACRLSEHVRLVILRPSLFGLF